MERAIVAGEPWTCPTCNDTVSTSFCPACGECPLRARDLSLRGLLNQFAQVFTNIDGPLLRSFRCLVARPGLLTVAYLRGQRKPYTLPLQLFFVVNVVFFAMQTLTDARIFSTPLDVHLHSDIWGWVAQPLVAHRVEAKGTTLDLYLPIFNQAVALNAKSLIILMVPPFALCPAMVFYRSRRPFVAHLVFSLHFYAFLLLLLSVSLVGVGVDMLFGGRGLESERLDHALSIVEVAACAIYLYIAAGTVYGARRASRIFKALVLTLAVTVIFLGYRFALLLITLYST